MSEFRPFQYELLPLDRSKKEIRLLKLVLEEDFLDHLRDLALESSVVSSSGRWNRDNESENISSFNNRLDEAFDVGRDNGYLNLGQSTRCEIFKASLESPPEFFALSYVWGPSTKSRRIILRVTQARRDPVQDVARHLDEFEVEITDNLHLALAHFKKRQANRTIFLWVDAVCINQKDDVEKSWQVQMMREIYKKSTSVYAWLGSMPQGQYIRVKTLLGNLEKLAHAGVTRFGWNQCTLPLEYKTSWPDGQREFMNEDLIEWLESRIAFVYPDGESGSYLMPRKAGSRKDALQFWEEELNQLRKILMAPFWNRVWILQEVVLAESVLFHYGFCSIEAVDLHAGLQLLAKASYLLGIDIMKPYDVLRSSPPRIKNSNNPRQWNIGFLDIYEPTFCPVLEWRYPDRGMGEPKICLTDIMKWNYRNGHLRASFESDYIYGFLGMVNDHGAAELIPDYTKSFQQIHVEAATRWIDEIGLETLTYCQKTTMQSDMPSWVPGFSNPDVRWLRIWDMHPDLARMGLESVSRPDFRFITTPSGPALASMGIDIATIQKPLVAMPQWNRRSPLIRRIWDIQGRLIIMKRVVEDLATAYKSKEDRVLAFANTLVAGGNDRGRLLNPEEMSSLDQILRGFTALIEPSSNPISYSGFSRKEVVCSFFRDAARCACAQAHMLYGEPEIERPDLWFGPLFYELVQIIDSPSDDRHRQMFEDISLFLDMVRLRNAGRKVFLCQDGYLALAPKLSIPGDIIAQLDGCRVPFVLRPGSNGSFYLVGEAYIYGVMEPELSDKQKDLGFKDSREAKATINCRGKDLRREFTIQ
ncbi:hypothetical protein ABKA04_005981 [Annulohypoxylon sp. FPYF3050]